MGPEIKILPRPGRDTFALGAQSRTIVQSYYEDLSGRLCGRLVEKKEILCSGIVNHWFEYVPASYDGSRPVPLVISCHAGHYYALAQVFDTCWCELSEREGFIAVFPEATTSGCWTTAEESRKLESNATDFVFIRKLLDDLQERYHVDHGRIYMHGMSRGNAFVTEFAIHYGELLAGIGESCGPSSPDIIDCSEDGLLSTVLPMPTCQMRNAYDRISPYRGYDRRTINTVNRTFWSKANGCTRPPVLRIGSRELFAYYNGERADLLYREAACHNHCETVSDAEDCWALFSTVRRGEDGKMISTGLGFEGDRNAIALADRSEYAYVDNRRTPVGGRVLLFREVNQRKRGGFQNPMRNDNIATPLDGVDMCVYYYAPISFVAKVFSLSVQDGVDTACLTMPDGSFVRFVRGSSAAVVNGRVRNMGQTARVLEEHLYIPIDWFAECIMGLCTAQKNGVLYIADHQVTMTEDFSDIIREIIG